MVDDALGFARCEADAGEGGAGLELRRILGKSSVNEDNRGDPRHDAGDDEDYEKRYYGYHPLSILLASGLFLQSAKRLSGGDEVPPPTAALANFRLQFSIQQFPRLHPRPRHLAREAFGVFHARLDAAEAGDALHEFEYVDVIVMLEPLDLTLVLVERL